MRETLSANHQGTLLSLLRELARGAPVSTGWEPPLVTGERLGRFQVIREIGRGASGVVYEALDRERRRLVALKALRLAGARGEAFLVEVEAAARLIHPNIVALHGLIGSPRGVCLVLERLRGETLAERLERGAIGFADGLGIVIQVAQALGHAHGAGVVHRDLSPANVFVCDDGRVKVLDFGLARALGRAGPAAGTPGFVSPEQLRGGPTDARSDLYALGVLLQTVLRRAVDAALGSRRIRSALEGLQRRLTSDDPAARPSAAAFVARELALIRAALGRTRRRRPRGRRSWTEARG